MNKQEAKKIKTYNDLYEFMRWQTPTIKQFIGFISDNKWVLKSFKLKWDRITVHVSDGSMTKPLFLNENLKLYENGVKASDDVQEVIQKKIDAFIIQYFKE